MLGLLQRLRPAVRQAALLQPSISQTATSEAAISQAAGSQSSVQQLTSLSPVAWRGISGSPATRGLEEFFDTPGKDGQPPAAGRAWMAKDLRNKSWDDLHKLWYVLLKERNMLQSEKLQARAAGGRLQNPFRLTKVRKGMARIKHVLNERAIAEPDPQKSAELKRFIDAI